jgi:hypothetical protein
MRFWLKLLAVLCLLAFLVGLSTGGATPRGVAISTVDPATCTANGPIVAVTTTDAPDVYDVHCRDGVVLIAGSR